VTRQLIVQATGVGKAVQAAMVPDAIHMPRNKRALFLVHRDELVFQAAEKFSKYNPHLTVGIEKAEYRADSSDIVVASVQTLGKATNEGTDGDVSWAYGKRIRQFAPEQFALIQVDESHHLSAKSQQWVAVLRYFRVLKGEENEEKGRLLCGWTATPNRSDNMGLELFFQKIVHEYGIREASKDGWLAPIRAFRVETEVDLSKVHTSMGDFDVAELEDAINTPERNELVARKYLEIDPPGPSIFFTSSVQHSHDLSDVMRKHGKKVYPLSGKTPDDERKRFIRLIKDGAIDGLASCGVLNEGTDLPAVVAAFMVRPTKSGLLYRQMCGRVLRCHPSPEELAEMTAHGEKPAFVKPFALIVDFCDNTGRHQLVGAATLFGLREKFDAKGKPLLDQVEEIEKIEQEHPGLDLRSCANLDAIKQSLQKLDLLKPPETPEEIRKVSRFNWLREAQDAYHLGLFDGAMLSIRVDTLGNFEIYRHVRGVRTKLWVAKSLKEALSEAEREIPDRDRQVMVATASWRREPPTDKQIGRLFYLDRKLRSQFKNAQDLYQFSLQRYHGGDGSFSRGSISQKISSLEVSRS
jgi:superfamily II DNA or RNA helicase